MNGTVKFNGTVDELKNILFKNNNKVLHVEWSSAKKFRFLAPSSNGTAMVKYNPGLIRGIHGYAIIEDDISDDYIKINLITKVRLELKLIILCGIIYSIIAIYTMKLVPALLILIFPVSYFWFEYIYREQEMRLINNLKNLIKNK